MREAFSMDYGMIHVVKKTIQVLGCPEPIRYNVNM